MSGAVLRTRHTIAVPGGAPRCGSPRGGGLGGRRVGHAVAAPDARPSVRPGRSPLPPSTAACPRASIDCCLPARGRAVEVVHGRGGGTRWALVVQSRWSWAGLTFFRPAGQEGSGEGREVGAGRGGGGGAAFGSLAVVKVKFGSTAALHLI